MNRCLPLRLTKKIVNRYSENWEYIQQFRDTKGNPPEADWDNRCYVPICGGVAIACEGNPVPIGYQMKGAIISAVASWRLNKQVYSFDRLIEETLLDREDDQMIISMDGLNHLPDFCVYIKTETILDLDGFFAYFESGGKDKPLELVIVLLSDDEEDVTPLRMHLIPGATISECIKNTFHEVTSSLSIHEDVLSTAEGIILDFYSKLMPFVLYVCYKNENTEKLAEKKQDSVKDTDDEVQYIHYGKDSGDIVDAVLFN